MNRCGCGETDCSHKGFMKSTDTVAEENGTHIISSDDEFTGDHADNTHHSSSEDTSENIYRGTSTDQVDNRVIS